MIPDYDLPRTAGFGIKKGEPQFKDVVDRIRRGRRGGPRVLTTRTVIVLGRTPRWPADDP